jgi:hypothetical protein
MIDAPFTASQPCFSCSVVPPKVPLASPHDHMLKFQNVGQAGFFPAFSFGAALKTRYSLTTDNHDEKTTT